MSVQLKHERHGFHSAVDATEAEMLIKNHGWERVVSEPKSEVVKAPAPKAPEPEKVSEPDWLNGTPEETPKVKRRGRPRKSD